MTTRRQSLILLAAAGFALTGCTGARLPATARLPRPERLYVEDFHATPAAVVVDTNQFSYVMEGLAMPRDARSRAADAAAAKAAIRETLLAELRALGFDARPGPPAGFTGNALVISGGIISIIEAIPSDLSTLSIGSPASEVDARVSTSYQFAGQPRRRWQDFLVHAPVVTSPAAGDTGAAGLPLTYLPPASADARTREVALQAHRLALRAGDRLRDAFRAEGWIAANPTPTAAPPP